jgi:hypothetical protein
MSDEPNSSNDNYTVDVEELVLPLKSTSSGLSSSNQLIDTSSNVNINYDSTG